MSYHDPRTAFVLDRRQVRHRMKMQRARTQFPLSKGVDRGLHELRRMHGDPADTYTAKLLRTSLRDFLEAIDAADVLLENGAVGAARAIGRTCVEQGGGVLYVIERNDERVSAARVLADFASMETSLKSVQARLDPGDRDDFGQDLAFERIALENSDYAMLKASQELKTLSEEGQLPWYASFGGPRGIAELLSVVGFPNIYDRFYRPWSAHVHGTINSSTAFSARNDYMTRPLRFFSDTDNAIVTGFLHIWCVVVTLQTSAYFFPNQVDTSFLEQSEELLKEMPGDLLFSVWDNIPYDEGE